MQQLSDTEIDAVAGGIVLPLIALAVAIVVNSDKLSEFTNGVFDGYGGL